MIAKQYLKMADGFKSGAKWFGDALREETGAADELINSAVHAINSHDELVAENERLRELVSRMGVYLELSGEYPEKESDNPIRQWLYDSIEFMYGCTS